MLQMPLMLRIDQQTMRLNRTVALLTKLTAFQTLTISETTDKPVPLPDLNLT